MFSSNSSQISSAANYIEDVFSTYLYNGTGANQTITNGIDLAGKGGFVWIKSRSYGDSNCLFDTQRGAGLRLISNLTNAQYNTGTETLSSFDSTGFSLGNDVSGYGVNRPSNTYASWTFRKQPKFFDVITYTGNGLSSNVISHNLGSVPGFIICKRTDSTSGWAIWHRGNGTTSYGLFALNTTDAAMSSTAPTSTTFDAYNIWDTGNPANASGGTYVAYLFAHNAGGFGLTGTDNVISCGSFTTNGSGAATVTLGYEPQWVMTKIVSDTGNWVINDNMRGMPASQTSQVLYPNLSAAESSSIYFSTQPNATGFTTNVYANNPSQTIIYIAIRRGPMKVPTDATKVFAPVSYTGSGATRVISTSPLVVPDQLFIQGRSGAATYTSTRLAGSQQYLSTQSTVAEANGSPYWISMDVENGYQISGSSGGGNSSGVPYIAWAFGRAPSFFDEVCFNGSDTDFTVNHNLQAIPELIILKKRSGVGSWFVGGTIVGFNATNNNNNLFLNNTNAVSTATIYTATWTSSAMYMSGGANFASGTTVVGYLFATCAGVSKVTSFTGNGSTQTINCGFTSGARFVLIKATSTTGNWLTFDTARGMTTSTDPWLALNSTAAESATTGACTTTSVGFTVDESKLTGVNTNGVSYIALAIA